MRTNNSFITGSFLPHILIRSLAAAREEILDGLKLAVDPEGYGLPLRGPLAGYWKHEFATHRIIYRIYKDHRIVAVCAVGSRKQGDAEDIYNQLRAVAETGRLADQIASVLKRMLPKKE